MHRYTLVYVCVGVMIMHDCLPIGNTPIHVHRYTLVYVCVGVMIMHDCLPIGTIPIHVYRYTLVYDWHLWRGREGGRKGGKERSHHLFSDARTVLDVL